MFTNFPTPKNYNLAGLAGFKFAHYADIAAYTGIFDSKIIMPITFNAGKFWLEGHSTLYSLNFNESIQETDNGKIYDQIVSGFIPGDKNELIALMDKMDGNYFTVLIKDTNKQNRLVGGYGKPMLFSSVFDSGLLRSDSKGYTFKFTSQSTFRAPVYL